MTNADFIALAPMIAIGLASIVVLLQISFIRSHKAAFILVALGHIISFALLPKAWAIAPHKIAPLLIIDRYSLFFF